MEAGILCQLVPALTRELNCADVPRRPGWSRVREVLVCVETRGAPPSRVSIQAMLGRRTPGALGLHLRWRMNDQLPSPVSSVGRSGVTRSGSHGPPPVERVRQLEAIAKWMDRRYVDPILGLVFPGAGDALGAIIGLYGVLLAAQLRLHPLVVARMLVNLALDALIGSVPLIGWIGDFFYRAHERNLELLKSRGPHGEATGSDWLMVVGAVALFLFALILPVILFIAGITWLFTRLG